VRYYYHRYSTREKNHGRFQTLEEKGKFMGMRKKKI